MSTNDNLEPSGRCYLALAIVLLHTRLLFVLHHVTSHYSKIPQTPPLSPHELISSTPFLTTPTTAPVCITSLAPLAMRCSISAKPLSQVIITSGLTAILDSSSDSAVMMSASARPRVTLSALIVLRQLVTSVALSSVEVISLMASGGGAAMQL